MELLPTLETRISAQERRFLYHDTLIEAMRKEIKDLTEEFIASTKQLGIFLEKREDRLNAIEAIVARLEVAAARLETTMATKDDLARVTASMATKDDLAKVKDDLAKVKDDLAKVTASMATKDDLAKVKDDLAKVTASMATKDDLAVLFANIKQLVTPGNTTSSSES